MRILLLRHQECHFPISRSFLYTNNVLSPASASPLFAPPRLSNSGGGGPPPPFPSLGAKKAGPPLPPSLPPNEVSPPEEERGEICSVQKRRRGVSPPSASFSSTKPRKIDRDRPTSHAIEKKETLRFLKEWKQNFIANMSCGFFKNGLISAESPIFPCLLFGVVK